jgi:hypothetical protein
MGGSPYRGILSVRRVGHVIFKELVPVRRGRVISQFGATPTSPLIPLLLAHAFAQRGSTFRYVFSYGNFTHLFRVRMVAPPTGNVIDLTILLSKIISPCQGFDLFPH